MQNKPCLFVTSPYFSFCLPFSLSLSLSPLSSLASHSVSPKSTRLVLPHSLALWDTLDSFCPHLFSFLLSLSLYVCLLLSDLLLVISLSRSLSDTQPLCMR